MSKITPLSPPPIADPLLTGAQIGAIIVLGNKLWGHDWESKIEDRLGKPYGHLTKSEATTRINQMQGAVARKESREKNSAQSES